MGTNSNGGIDESNSVGAIYIGERWLYCDGGRVEDCWSDMPINFPVMECHVPGVDCAYALAPFIRSGRSHDFSRALLHYRSRSSSRAFGSSRPFVSCFAKMLSAAVRSLNILEKCNAIVPIPPKQGQEDRFYHLYDLMKELSRQLEAAIDMNMLSFSTDVPEMKEVPLRLRFSTIEGAMSAKNRADLFGVLLVDDIIATGATLAEAARALREVGVRQIVALSLAKRVI